MAENIENNGYSQRDNAEHEDFHPGFSGTEPVYFPSFHGSAPAADQKRLCYCTRQAHKKGRS